MNPYKEAYIKLFNTVTDTIASLQQVQADCEMVFMDDDTQAPQLHVFPTDKEGREGGK